MKIKERRLALILSKSWNNLLELKSVTAKANQAGRQRQWQPEHLIGNCILERGSSTALGRNCPISHRDDGARICSTSQPACQRQSWRRAAHLLLAAALNYGGGRRRGARWASRVSKVWLSPCSLAWCAHISSPYLLACSFSCHSYGNQMWNASLFRLKVPLLTQGMA